MANPFALERPRTRAKVMALVIDGKSDAQVADAVSTPKVNFTRQAITAFRHRHADELHDLTETVERDVTDYAIASKVRRIATYDMLRNLLLQVLSERAAGGTGIETGLVVRREKALGSGNNMTIVEEYEIDPALVTLIDKLHNSTANELGQLPKGDGAHAMASVVNIVRIGVPELGI